MASERAPFLLPKDQKLVPAQEGEQELEQITVCGVEAENTFILL